MFKPVQTGSNPNIQANAFKPVQIGSNVDKPDGGSMPTHVKHVQTWSNLFKPVQTGGDRASSNDIQNVKPAGPQKSTWQ
jgi:dethiobiotin synthetase